MLNKHVMMLQIKRYTIGLMLVSTIVFPQSNRISLGGFFGSGLSVNANYSYEITTLLFLRPNVSAIITKDGKELYSFMSYELDLGFYMLNNIHNKIYITLGGSYNPFISQNSEGNASFISAIQPPYYFTGRSREDCYGISVKVGGLGIASTWFSLGLEAKYLILFPKVRYNYTPKEYSVIKDGETIKMILLGVSFGFSF